jgi:hypothetical protein
MELEVKEMKRKDKYGENLILRLGGHWWIIGVVFIAWVLGILISQ